MRPYYDEHARAYFDATASVSMTVLYDRFLPLVRPGGSILDGGCGSGRDSLEFVRRGFKVVAFDASPEMARLASDHSGQAVAVMRFQDVAYESKFDAVWTCASLLHVPRCEILDVLERLAAALRPSGVWFMAFKKGVGDRVQEDGRLFSDYTPESLRDQLSIVGGLSIIDLWETDDVRPGRDERWVNCIVRRN